MTARRVAYVLRLFPMISERMIKRAEERFSMVRQQCH
jgi:hypothetical protein